MKSIEKKVIKMKMKMILITRYPNKYIIQLKKLTKRFCNVSKIQTFSIVRRKNSFLVLIMMVTHRSKIKQLNFQGLKKSYIRTKYIRVRGTSSWRGKNKLLMIFPTKL